ncbi:hypothetical protein Alches_23090 [Alicyclobacillus hesperidum subsp. aegles]|uniref:helix-turn-helix domain-containing protein n=1 Tax=Alicyclobacillus hesperidum TaxID=89784 RepID=UPI00222B5A60|nr:helix-turn-helix domain-containing protein [Alicyclobacillus hesperidum]GLG02268.1 hypothetical protein Alches_23090 [Alicyclobacillus hesperidum subsp. aegles]
MRWFAGMERNRSKFGEWLERHGVSQTDLSKMSGVPDSTINNLATSRAQHPTRLTARKLMEAIREIDPEARFEDFWG